MEQNQLETTAFWTILLAEKRDNAHYEAQAANISVYTNCKDQSINIMNQIIKCFRYVRQSGT